MFKTYEAYLWNELLIPEGDYYRDINCEGFISPSYVYDDSNGLIEIYYEKM